MAEIKSTIDLVMERTKNMGLTEEEKKQARIEEAQKRAKGLALALEEHRLDPKDLLQTMADSDVADKDALKRFTALELVNRLSLEADNQPLLDALPHLVGDRLQSLIPMAKDLFAQFQANREQMNQEASGSILDQLAAMGITGSALVPLTESDSDFTNDLNQTMAMAQAQLAQIQDHMRLAAGLEEE
jgi:hypothetical protein